MELARIYSGVPSAVLLPARCCNCGESTTNLVAIPILVIWQGHRTQTTARYGSFSMPQCTTCAEAEKSFRTTWERSAEKYGGRGAAVWVISAIIFLSLFNLQVQGIAKLLEFAAGAVCFATPILGLGAAAVWYLARMIAPRFSGDPKRLAFLPAPHESGILGARCEFDGVGDKPGLYWQCKFVFGNAEFSQEFLTLNPGYGCAYKDDPLKPVRGRGADDPRDFLREMEQKGL